MRLISRQHFGLVSHRIAYNGSDGTPYLPEIKFRRILLKAFGPGGWGLVPRGKHTLIGKNLSREYALFIEGRFVSQARGEIVSIWLHQVVGWPSNSLINDQDIQSSSMSLATAAESVRSDALKRCCKDIGIASELVFIGRGGELDRSDLVL